MAGLQVGAAAGAPSQDTLDARAGMPAVRAGSSTTVAPGVTFNHLHLATTHGVVTGYQLTVDLTQPGVQIGLLHPPSVADRMPVSEMADAQGAVAGVNGDFFNISESDHPGVPPTYSSEGAEISDFVALKGPVPEAQAFAGPLPGPPSTADVLAVDATGRAEVTSLALDGTVRTPTGTFPLAGLNQYAISENGIGAFTHAWGDTSRLRAICGDDTNRHAPCSTDTAVVTVRRGRVTSLGQTPGPGSIPGDAVELVGREAGADFLRGLAVSEPVSVTDQLAAPATGARLRFAIGGFQILRNRTTVDGVRDIGAVPAARTGAGGSADGHTLYLVTVEGTESSSGLTCTELADVLRNIGADDAVDLDGGGSSTFVVREPGDTHVTVENKLPSGAQRPVPNGLGIFLAPDQVATP